MKLEKFLGREIPPYGEFVKSGDLVEGQLYFRVSYLDNDMLIPELVPLVFIGRNLGDEDTPDRPLLYFQDAASHRTGVRWGSLSEGDLSYFESDAETEYTPVFEFEKALNALLLCSLRRQRKGVHG